MAHVLVLHDEPVFRMLFTRTCEDEGYQTMAYQPWKPHSKFCGMRVTPWSP